LVRQQDYDSGVLIRFPDPDTKGYDNTAFVAGDFGLEVQIDQRGAPDGAAIHKTAAIYDLASPKDPNNLPVKPLGQWNIYEIHVQAQSYRVVLNGQEVTGFNFTVGSDTRHPDRGLPSTPNDPRFIGLQTYKGRVGFRNIEIKAL
jgi:Domain of Unknown Function (DUF1080)